MKTISAIILSALIASSAIRPARAEGLQPSQTEGRGAQTASPTIVEPTVKALGAVLMDYQTGRVLWGKNEHEPMAMASTTKIMTAVIAIESGKLGELCTASQRAAQAPAVKMGLSSGETVKMSDLMYALMLESQNDAAVAIAEHIGGTVEDFCAMMTEKAKAIGALDTVFETPNGLDKGDHHSTAYDMALIARYALTIPMFVEITNTEGKSFSSSKRTYSFVNKNRLLSEYEGANGMKTGFTGKAGHCFVGAAQRGGMELISVVLASGWGNVGKQGKWTDTKALLDYGFKNFSYKNIVQAGQEAGTVQVGRSLSNGVACVFGQDLVLPLRSDEVDGVEVSTRFPDEVLAPVAPGDIVGEADVLVNGQLFARIPLTALAAAERHDLKTSFEKVINCVIRLSTRADIEIVLPELYSRGR